MEPWGLCSIYSGWSNHSVLASSLYPNICYILAVIFGRKTNTSPERQFGLIKFKNNLLVGGCGYYTVVSCISLILTLPFIMSLKVRVGIHLVGDPVRCVVVSDCVYRFASDTWIDSAYNSHSVCCAQQSWRISAFFLLVGVISCSLARS